VASLLGSENFDDKLLAMLTEKPEENMEVLIVVLHFKTDFNDAFSVGVTRSVVGRAATPKQIWAIEILAW